MKGKSVPMSVYAVGEETGTRESVATARLPLLGRDEELGDGAPGRRGGAGRSRRGAHRSTAPPAWASPACAQEVARRGGSPTTGDRAARRALRRLQRLPGAARPRARAARHPARRARRRWVRRPARPSSGARPTCCRWPRCSPTSSRSTCRPPRRPTASTPSTGPTESPTSSSSSSAALLPGPMVAARRGRPLGRRRVGPPARPGGRRDGGSAVGGRRGAPRRRAGASPRTSGHARRPRPAAARGRRAARHRRHRGDPPAPARDRRGRRAGRGQPAVRRGGHPPRPRLRVASSRCPSRSRPP